MNHSPLCDKADPWGLRPRQSPRWRPRRQLDYFQIADAGVEVIASRRRTPFRPHRLARREYAARRYGRRVPAKTWRLPCPVHAGRRRYAYLRQPSLRRLPPIARSELHPDLPLPVPAARLAVFLQGPSRRRFRYSIAFLRLLKPPRVRPIARAAGKFLRQKQIFAAHHKSLFAIEIHRLSPIPGIAKREPRQGRQNVYPHGFDAI